MIENVRDIWGRPPSEISERHWQSGFPMPFTDLPKHGVDVVVLASCDTQPDPESLALVKKRCPNLKGILCPFEDTDKQVELRGIVLTASRAADLVLAHLENGKNVLVTCNVGRNRSGLISGLVLMRRFKISGQEAVRRVREARNGVLPPGEGALTNPMFATYLESLPVPT